MRASPTRSSSAIRRASYIACDSFKLPKLEAGCCSASSSTCASVIEVVPTVATTSDAVCGLIGCADVEHDTRSNQTPAARNSRMAHYTGGWGLVAGGAGGWAPATLVARGWWIDDRRNRVP